MSNYNYLLDLYTRVIQTVSVVNVYSKRNNAPLNIFDYG